MDDGPSTRRRRTSTRACGEDSGSAARPLSLVSPLRAPRDPHHPAFRVRADTGERRPSSVGGLVAEPRPALREAGLPCEGPENRRGAGGPRPIGEWSENRRWIGPRAGGRRPGKSHLGPRPSPPPKKSPSTTAPEPLPAKPSQDPPPRRSFPPFFPHDTRADRGPRSKPPPAPQKMNLRGDFGGAEETGRSRGDGCVRRRETGAGAESLDGPPEAQSGRSGVRRAPPRGSPSRRVGDAGGRSPASLAPPSTVRASW